MADKNLPKIAEDAYEASLAAAHEAAGNQGLHLTGEDAERVFSDAWNAVVIAIRAALDSEEE